MKNEKKQSLFSLSLDIRIYSVLALLSGLIAAFFVIFLLFISRYDISGWPWFLEILISGISCLFCFDRINTIDNKIMAIKCLSCNSQRVSPEIPFCKNCLSESIKEVQKLVEEAERRIKNASKLGLKNQVEGTRRWFFEKLPEPIKFILSQGILACLKRTFPQTEIINPKHFYKFPLDSKDLEVNMPSEALEILEELNPLLLS